MTMNTMDTIMNTTTEAAPSVAIKVSRGDEMRRLTFHGKSFQELKDTIAQIFNLPVTDFTLQYQDDEKDRVTLSTDSELKEAIQLHKYVLRFFVVATGDVSFSRPHPHHHHPHPHPYHRHHHHHGVASPPPHATAEGEVIAPPSPFGHHGHGRHGHHGNGPYGRPFGKRCLDKEEKREMKCERKRWKKQRKCEKDSSSSSSSSSSEDESQKKLQKKEMRQLMKATKMSIKATWEPTKQADPAKWPENRKLMMNEIKLAKRLIREQAKKSNSPAVVTADQNTSSVVPVTGAEMQA